MTAETWLDWITKNAGSVTNSEPIGIGDGQRCLRVTARTGDRFFVKSFQGPQAEQQCRAECHGLAKLWQANRDTEKRLLQIAKPLVVGNYWFITELIDEQSPLENSWHTFGEGLAALHGISANQFGFDSDNYCGPTPQPNTVNTDGHQFFAQQRLMYQATLNSNAGLLTKNDREQLERLCQKLPELIPVQAPSLIHGDLWQGNLLFDHNQNPVLIDPACYYGWAEAELAMTILFGGFDKNFYSVYEANSNIDKHWRERAPVYNLYHLLNHLYLFGGGYYADVKAILNRWA